jgi:hypothetical protein
MKKIVAVGEGSITIGVKVSLGINRISGTVYETVTSTGFSLLLKTDELQELRARTITKVAGAKIIQICDVLACLKKGVIENIPEAP